MTFSEGGHRMRRREWLGAVGAAGAAALLGGAAARPPRATLGVMSDVYGQFPAAEAARRIKADGFGCVVSNLAFADVRFDPLAPDPKALDAIRAAFDGQGVRISSLFGYYNVVDPDPERRRRGEARMAALLAACRALGCPSVSTETGTKNRESEWLESPENDTEAAFVECRDALARLADTAHAHGVQVAVEPYWRNIISTVERAERLFREVDAPGLALVMDPCNFYRKEDLPRMRPLLEAMFARLGDRISIAHAKDVKPAAEGTDLPAAGLGVLDYPLYTRLLAGLGRPLDLVIEHLALPDVPRARDFVLEHGRAAGIL